MNRKYTDTVQSCRSRRHLLNRRRVPQTWGMCRSIVVDLKLVSFAYLGAFLLTNGSCVMMPILSVVRWGGRKPSCRPALKQQLCFLKHRLSVMVCVLFSLPQSFQFYVEWFKAPPITSSSSYSTTPPLPMDPWDQEACLVKWWMAPRLLPRGKKKEKKASFFSPLRGS